MESRIRIPPPRIGAIEDLDFMVGYARLVDRVSNQI